MTRRSKVTQADVSRVVKGVVRAGVVVERVDVEVEGVKVSVYSNTGTGSGAVVSFDKWKATRNAYPA